MSKMSLNQFLLLLSFLVIAFPYHATAIKLTCITSSCTSPPRHQSPPPSEVLTFADQRLAAVYPVIQKFKATVTSDPLGVTNTWVGADICSYRGFYCDNLPDNKSAVTVASVDFNRFQLSAPSLDGFLDRLLDIALFHANSNSFAGAVPRNVSKLRYLYELDLSNNRLSGPFPDAVLAMPDLSFLDLRFNLFAGAIPPQIFADKNLDFLFLNDNGFTNNLPYPTHLSSHLLFLTLANNRFSGQIPRNVSMILSSATEILLLNNSLSGCVPYEVGLLTAATVFDVGSNRLTGPLPFSLGCMEGLEQLNFAGNQLFGVVPEIVCGLGNLVNLSLSDNYFTVVGPACRALLWSGVLDVRKNCVPDLPDQRSPVECGAFFATPRVCPNMETYAIVPCYKFPHPLGSNHTSIP